jgi:putative ABC transport system permease protein
MIALLRQLSWPELRHHPWRNAAALVAVMLGVALARRHVEEGRLG